MIYHHRVFIFFTKFTVNYSDRQKFKMRCLMASKLSLYTELYEFETCPQFTFICSKSTIETLEKDAKNVQS